MIGADTFSKVTDWSRRDCVVFGDGAGAVVLERKDRENGLFSSILLAEGEGIDKFTVYPGDAYFTMNGKAVYQMATTSVPECIQEILRINGLGLEDVSMIVPHQATAGVLKRIARYSTSLFPGYRRTWSPTRTPPEPQFRCSWTR